MLVCIEAPKKSYNVGFQYIPYKVFTSLQCPFSI